MTAMAWTDVDAPSRGCVVSSRRGNADAASSRSGRQPPQDPVAAEDPDGGRGDIHDLLTAAVDEAARLLDADGAMVYLLDAATGTLRFAHDAGIRMPPAATVSGRSSSPWVSACSDGPSPNAPW
jgi:hypothetical protein